MIASINYPIKDLVVIDNGAKANSWHPVWNNWVHKTHHIKLPSNFGVAGSWNLGIKSLPFSDYWLISNFDVEFGGDALQMFAEKSHPEKLLLSGGAPEWCAFSVGWKVVDKVGLFDESLHPAYFEDNDFERRCLENNMTVEHSFIPVAHDNSSTLKAGFQHLNDTTFADNASYYQQKIANKDLTEGKWSIRRRRRNAWDNES
jgi:hypothetical protein